MRPSGQKRLSGWRCVRRARASRRHSPNLLRKALSAKRRHSSLRGGICTTTPRGSTEKSMSTPATLKYIPWNKVEREHLNPLIDREMVVGDQVMLARVLMKKGAHVPLHHHHNEQVTYILEGALKFAIDGKEIVVRAGEVLCIPPHMPHEAWALEDTVDLDVFNPPREDWLNKTDNYLRHGR